MAPEILSSGVVSESVESSTAPAWVSADMAHPIRFSTFGTPEA